MHIRAVIPHYFSEDVQKESISEIGCGFGSRTPGARLSRTIALSRCLLGLLNLRRSRQDLCLNLVQATGKSTPETAVFVDSPDISLEIVLVVHADHFLLEAIQPLVPQVRVLQLDLTDPRCLGLEARDWLIHHPSPADLNLYLEDDLVIHDPFLPEKILWMALQSDHQCVLLPHRYELTKNPLNPPRLYIDGPIEHHVFSDWHQPQRQIAKGSFRFYPNVEFDIPSNPHAGFFGVSRQQLLRLRESSLPRDGFVGPLETAATYTVGTVFKLLKPSLNYREFLTIEHAHPSYLGYLVSDNE